MADLDWYGICAVGAYFDSPTDEYSVFSSWGFLDDFPLAVAVEAVSRFILFFGHYTHRR